MLVLSRKLSESIRIGDEIVVTVLGIRGNRVRIGVEAPVPIAVRRTELMPKIPGPLDFPSSVVGVLAHVSVGCAVRQRGGKGDRRATTSI